MKSSRQNSHNYNMGHYLVPPMSSPHSTEDNACNSILVQVLSNPWGISTGTGIGKGKGIGAGIGKGIYRAERAEHTMPRRKSVIVEGGIPYPAHTISSWSNVEPPLPVGFVLGEENNLNMSFRARKGGRA